jgi:hypothetical protein
LSAYARPNPEDATKKIIKFVSDNSLPQYCDDDGHLYTEALQIPCGQCIGCRLEYSRQWAIRCVLEAQKWKYNYFLTLTYDDEHLPTSIPKINNETGEVVFNDNSSLDRRDVVLFIKHLRRELDRLYGHQGVRVFYCGEYGEKYSRPHYHILLFNSVCLSDLVLYKKNLGNPLYNSKFLDKIWKKGFVVVGNVTFESAAYVARYIMKKQKGPGSADYYAALGVVPEFTGCSRRPGIARFYYDDNSDNIYRYDRLYVSKANGDVLSVRPPAYFDRLFRACHPDEFVEINWKRKLSGINSRKFILSRTSLPEKAYLALCESNVLDRAKKLLRPIS